MDQYADGQPLTSNTGAWLDFAQKPWEAGGLGLAKHQAAGLVGNLVNESGADLNPWGPTGDNSTAWGTAQWRGDRLDKLKTMFPDNYHTVEAQQAFMRHEFETSENKALRALQNASTPEEAADAVNHLYERSADTTGRRAAAASAIYNGQDPAAAMNAAIKSGGGRGALAYAAGDDGEDDTGALSANSALGRGALQTIMPDAKEDDGIHKWGKKLTMAGAALASISSPQQAYALNSQAAQMGKEDDPKFTTRIGKDGSIYRMSSGGGVQVYRPGGSDPAAGNRRSRRSATGIRGRRVPQLDPRDPALHRPGRSRPANSRCLSTS
jgi:hypothetical protein